MKKIIFTVFFILSLIFFGSHYFQTTNETNIEIPITASGEQPNNTIKSNLQTESLSPKNTVSVTTNQLNETVKNKTSTKIEQLLNSAAFESPKNVDDSFVSSENLIYKSTLETIFASKDFTKVIDKIMLIDKDHKSLAREEALYKKVSDLSNITGSKFYSEKYSCSGRICIIEFNYNNSEIDQAQLSNISDFDSNYSFSSFSQSDNGEMIYRGIYIETDDPSSLKLSLN